MENNSGDWAKIRGIYEETKDLFEHLPFLYEARVQKEHRPVDERLIAHEQLHHFVFIQDQMVDL